MLRKLIKVLLVLVVLVVAAGVVGIFYLDSIVKAGLEAGGTYALGVDTRAAGVNVSLLRGRLAIDGLNIANPEGYTTPHLMHGDHMVVELRPGSLFSDAVELPTFEIDGLDVCIEQGLTASNVSKIMDHLKKFDTGEKKTKEGGKKVKVDRIVIRNVVAHVQMLPGLNPAPPTTIKIGDIELNNVTSDNANGVAISQLMARVVPAILSAVVERAGDAIPPAMRNPLKTDLGEVPKTLGSGLKGLLSPLGKPK